jgi:hypothetical protein
MKEQIIHLEPHDDIISVRDKLGWIRTQGVLLVFPEGHNARVLQRKLDLVIIQREATRRKAQLALITADPEVIDNARDLGIPCFPSVEHSQREHWRTRRARLAVSRQDQPQPLSPELAEAASRFQPPQPPHLVHLQRIVALLLAAVALVLLLTGAYIVLPGAQVRLIPASEQVSITTPVIADPNLETLDVERGLIPARIVGVEVEWSTAVKTTGTKDMPTTKSTGVVVFSNLVPDQVNVPAGTFVRTTAANPVRFATTSDVTLPARVGATGEATVEAVEPGVEGNLPSTLINSVEGPLARRVAVNNPEPTRGGDVAQVPAVTQSDYDRLRAALLQELQQRAYAEIQTDPLINLSETEFVVPESLQVVLVLDETYDKFIGEQAEAVGLDMRVVVQGVVADERTARQVIYAALAQKIGPGYRIGGDTLDFRRGEVTNIDENRRVTFIMHGTGEVATAIDPAAVRAAIAGKRLDEAQQILMRQFRLDGPPVITPWPGFWKRLPLLPFRIQVEVTSP